MKKVIAISEEVGNTDIESARCDVYATARAEYDEAQSLLVVQLDSHLWTNDPGNPQRTPGQDWLPVRQTVREHMPYEDTVAETKEIFRSWARKVRQSVPTMVNL